MTAINRLLAALAAALVLVFAWTAVASAAWYPVPVGLPSYPVRCCPRPHGHHGHHRHHHYQIVRVTIP
jgi:hypothetical protein